MAITLASTLPSGTDVQEIGANASGGMRVGASSSELLSFHGATAVDQAATQASITLPGWSAGGYGATGTATMTSIINVLNAVTACLREKGLMASE